MKLIIYSDNPDFEPIEAEVVNYLCDLQDPYLVHISDLVIKFKFGSMRCWDNRKYLGFIKQDIPGLREMVHYGKD